jgi:hypothetical protein
MAEARQKRVERGKPPSESESDLDFKRKRMVGWFEPKQLTGTGIKVLLSSLFGAYSDKREIQAALHPDQKSDEIAHDYSSQKEIWFDYIGDTGDGWDSTYTMARLLAEPGLKLGGEETPQGQVLILGGDQVYPAAKREEYNDRFIGPYKSALPCARNGQAPDMFAVPGNHDWYDGLTSFLRLFCQGRTIGGWQTKQKYSYFAIKLPHKWWLWALDIQFEADIDKPQLDYFENIASKHFKEGGDRVILCNAAPSWLDASVEDPGAYKNLVFFEREYIRRLGGEAVLMLSGDLHHYCRYAAIGSARQKITSGGGGAYLYPTHRMPEELHLEEAGEPSEISGGAEGYRLKYRKGDKPFPSAETSKRLRKKVLLFPFKNLKFCLLLCFLYLVFAWLLESGSQIRPQSFANEVSWLSPLEAISYQRVFWATLDSLKHSPSSVLFVMAILAGLYLFSGKEKLWHRLAGIAHGVAHIGLNVCLIWGFVYLNRWVFKMTRLDNLWHASLFSAEMFAIGGIMGGLLMGMYLLLSEYGKLHTNEVFSALRIEDHKNFLRLHIDETGGLRIFPAGVSEICREWKFNPHAANGQPWFEPEDGSDESRKRFKARARLIEGPIEIETNEEKSHAGQL